ncbi:MAG: hypothetical protein HQK49_13380 [Oligoflexia bacterium]|nr:hypothetical protein [Oligoflexia bacterium]
MIKNNSNSNSNSNFNSNSSSSDIIKKASLIKIIRNFFSQDDFLEIISPPMVENPGMEAHVHPFKVTQARAPVQPSAKISNLYLHTSPEFYLKKMLSLGLQKIYSIVHSFRDDIKSPIHQNQFLMLEWYRANEYYTKIMDDCDRLIKFALHDLKKQKIKTNFSEKEYSLKRVTVKELFEEYLKIDILEYMEVSDLKRLMELNFPEVPLPAETLFWDDYFFLLFLNKIEPHLATTSDKKFLLLYEFPKHLAALSTIKRDDPRVCERFEIYINGIEICNAYNELTNLQIQQERFEQQNNIKKSLYQYELPPPNVLYQALSNGIPPSAGIALGIERFLLALVSDINNPFA